MVPVAPGLFSTTIETPKFFAMLSARTRPRTSVEPPTDQGITIVIGRCGYPDAAALKPGESIRQRNRLRTPTNLHKAAIRISDPLKVNLTMPTVFGTREGVF